MSRKRLLLCLCLLLARAAASQAQPDIALSDTTHNYGDVAVGDTASWAFKIYNVGTDTLVVDSTTFTPSPFEVGAPTFPETVAVNDSIEVTVWFIPSAMDSVSDTLNIHSNDPTDSVVYVYLSGRGLAPDIALSDTSHNFATILVGDSADWVLTIFNLGTDTLTVDSVLVDPSQFEVSTPTFPDTIPPADSVQVTVWFLPSDTGAVAGSLLVFSNDPDEETLAVALSGTGVLQDIALSDTSHDFGDVLVGDSLDWVLTIYNEGTAELTVDSIPSAPTEFEV
ncbi:MAG: choice-of-anchor D domain-containing protein, partial [bacterium]